LHLVFQLGWWLPIHLQFRNDNRDLFIYHQAAHSAVKGEKIYTPVPDYGPDSIPNTFLYPPPFAAAILPLGHLSLPEFTRMWYWLLILCFWIYAASLAYLATGRVTAQGVLVAGLLSAIFPGTAQGMSLGNAQPLINALWGLALALGPRGRGLALAAAALIKIHPLLSLMVAWKYEKASRWSSLCVLVPSVAAGFAIFGVQAHRDWWRFAQPVVSQASFVSSNVSLSFLPLRLWKACGGYEGGPLPSGARNYLMLVALAAPIVTLWLARHLEPRLQMAAVGCVAVLFAPLCWDYYLPMLLVPLALLIKESNAPEK
jgi:hypothetical protein